MKIQEALFIDGKTISSNGPTYFIADIAANHDGDIGRAKELIWKASDAGADAAKFQHFKAQTIVSDHGFKQLGNQKSHQANWNKSVYDVYKDAELNHEWTHALKKTCDDAKISFFTSPYDFDLVDFVDPFVPAHKIGSGDITWIEMIEYIASKGKPLFLASGASTMDDVVRAVSAALRINPQICLMQCNTNYTASMENFKYIQLNVIKCFREMFPGMVLGLSDHTPGHTTVLGAIALGARVIEKHFTDSNDRAGPDHKFSMNPYDWREMVLRARELEVALGMGIKQVEQNERDTVVLQRRAIRLNKDLLTGSEVSHQDIVYLRPCPDDALPLFYSKMILNKKLKVNKNSGDYLRYGDIDIS